MHSLALIHIVSSPITTFPSFNSLAGLKSINLAALKSVATLPSFDALVNLERIVFNSMVGLVTVPNLDATNKLATFVSVDRGAFCYNGVLGSQHCNLSHSMCKLHPVFKTPAVTQCVSETQQASAATRAVFDRFNRTACVGEALRPGQRKAQPTLAEILTCNGTMYRECRVPGSSGSGMCYNARWMAVACDVTPFAMEMRRQQIAQGRGTPCNSAYEA